MIVSNNISPNKNLYFIGGEILLILNEKDKIDIIKLHKALNNLVKVNFVLYTYALDWLYISGLIENDKKGRIIKCI